MSKIFDALAREEADVPPLALSALLEELAAAKSRLRSGEAAGMKTNDAPAEFDQPDSPQRPAVRKESFQIPAQSPLLPFDGSNKQAAEQYRIARTRISQHPKQPSMLVVSSAGEGDGKTVTAINLAASLSLRDEGEVLLVDADLRRGSVHRQLGLSASAGLAEVLGGRNSLEQALIHAEQFPNLYILQAGNASSNPGELLDSSRWRNLGKQLRQLFEYVVIDSPPVSGVADYQLIEAVCDGTLLVVRPDHTKRSMAAEALKLIAKERLVGVVMNCVPRWLLE